MPSRPVVSSSLPRRIAGAILLSIAAGAVVAAERGPAPRATADAAEDPAVARVIVRYRDDGALKTIQSAAVGGAADRPQHAAVLSQRLGLALADGRAIGSRMQALHARGLSSSELAARLAADPDVEFAVPSLRRHPHAVVPNDPYYGPGQTTVTPAVGQWYLRAPDATIVSAINAVGAWGLTLGSPSVVVAVLDTGVRFDHPDLAGKLHAGYDFVSDATEANDGDARDADASDPGDWTTAGQCGRGQPAVSSSWHGTQVSGLIAAATDNGVGMAAVGRDSTVLPVRVLGKCGGFDDDILAAMLWAAGLSSDPAVNAHPARVINLSLGSNTSCSAAYASVIAQLTAAGVSVVASAGNDEGLAVSSPANCAGVIAVAGVRHAGTKVGFSSIGPQVAISAPAGNCVNTSGACLYPLLTTTNAGTTVPAANTYSSSNDASLGTSFSSPLVAGTMALMLSVNPSLTPAQLKSLLQASARPFPTSGAASAAVTACRAPSSAVQDECYCTATTCGAGMLDASAAVAAVQAANLPVAAIVPAAASVAAGTTLTLDGSSSRAAGGGNLTYQWTIASGAALAAFTSATNAATATLAANAAGTVGVMLTVTDSAGRQTSTTASVTITAAATGGSGSTGGTGGSTGGSGGTTTGGGGSGGGAIDAGALVGLAGAALALAARRRGALGRSRRR